MMINSIGVPKMEEEQTLKSEKLLKGKGRGSNFCVIDKSEWKRLWTVPTKNRMNLVIAYIVLLVGTGNDHKLTKWSAKACEDHVGIGKPRAKKAIEELIESKFITHTEESKRLKPQYEICNPADPEDENPIFLPNQIVTGLAKENSMLRRVKETGDPLALKLFIETYAGIELDRTFGLPASKLKKFNNKQSARKISEIGTHAIWALPMINCTSFGEGFGYEYLNEHEEPESFWDRLRLLEKVNAVYFDYWVFDSDADDAEPLFPIDPSVFYSSTFTPNAEAELTRKVMEVSALLTSEMPYLTEQYYGDLIVAFPAHMQPPAVMGVAKPFVEADTPGRRMTYAKRRSRVEQYLDAYERLAKDVAEGRYDRPLLVNYELEAA